MAEITIQEIFGEEGVHFDNIADHDEIRILGISTSPHHATTERLVKEALYAAGSGRFPGVVTDYISLADYKVNSCTGCRLCYGDIKGATGETFCYRWKGKDDGDYVIKKMLWADGIIFGSPVWVNYVCGPCKNLMDRCTVFCEHTNTLMTGTLRHRVVGAITVAFNRHGGQEMAAHMIWDWALICGMTPVAPFPCEWEHFPQASLLFAGASTSDAKNYEAAEAVTPEGSRVQPPIQAVQQLRGCRNLGYSVVVEAYIMKHGIRAAREKGFPMPEHAFPTKWPKNLMRKGSYLERLAKEGKIELV